jgi:hypothetical protein
VSVTLLGADGRTHTVGDDCPAQHYVSDLDGQLACGGDFMAGTICSEDAGHGQEHGCRCRRCGGDWMNGCSCPVPEGCEES